MTCCEYEDRLSAYMDGELPRWTRWKVQNHLRHCSQCSNSLRELAEIDGSLLGTCDEGVPDYLTGAIMHRLPAMPPARPMRGGFMPWGAGLAVAGMQALALFGAYWWGFMRGTTTPAPVGASLVSPGGGSSMFRSPQSVTPVSNAGNQPGSSSRRGPIWSHTPNGFQGVSPAELDRLEDASHRSRGKQVPVGVGTYLVPAPAGSR